MADDALFRPVDGATYLPTALAAGPWDQHILHGAAVAALFAGVLTPPSGTLARLTVELLGPVPRAPLSLERGELVGGRRVKRQAAELVVDGKPVASARSVVVREADLDLPDTAVDPASPFPPAEVPVLDEPNRAAADQVGWECFDSSALILHWRRVDGDRRVHAWVGLAVPVVEGTEPTGVELAAVAGDYGASATNRQLPYATWSFRNTELSLHLARHPVGRWIGMRSEGVVAPVGAGFHATDLFDEGGRVARSASALLIEPRG
jgi:hypothetical protein